MTKLSSGLWKIIDEDFVYMLCQREKERQGGRDVIQT